MSQEKKEKENTSPTTPAENPQGNTGQPAGSQPVPSVTTQDVFSSEVLANTAEDELFVGDLSFLKDLTRKTGPESSTKSGVTNPAIRSIFAVFIANMLLMLVLVGVVSFQPTRVVSFRVSDPSGVRTAAAQKAQTNVPASQQTSKQSQVNKVAVSSSDGLAEAMEKTVLTPQDLEVFKRGISLKTADDLYNTGRYVEACYVYNQISQNWVSASTNGQYMRDFLALPVNRMPRKNVLPRHCRARRPIFEGWPVIIWLVFIIRIRSTWRPGRGPISR